MTGNSTWAARVFFGAECLAVIQCCCLLFDTSDGIGFCIAMGFYCLIYQCGIIASSPVAANRTNRDERQQTQGADHEIIFAVFAAGRRTIHARRMSSCRAYRCGVLQRGSYTQPLS